MSRAVFLSRIFLLGSLLFLTIALIDFYNSRTPAPGIVSQPMIFPEQMLARQEAREAGRDTYEFTSNFIPGIGRLANPEAYKKDWEARIKNSEPSDFLPN